eukprot:631646-Amphidinium_carterae.1
MALANHGSVIESQSGECTAWPRDRADTQPTCADCAECERERERNVCPTEQADKHSGVGGSGCSGNGPAATPTGGKVAPGGLACACRSRLPWLR